MAEVFGYELVARALKNEGADTMFFIMGGPMLGAQDTCRKLGIRMIDVRHEQAAAMMANAYARLTGKAGVCSAASGPATPSIAPLPNSSGCLVSRLSVEYDKNVGISAPPAGSAPIGKPNRVPRSHGFQDRCQSSLVIQSEPRTGSIVS